MDGHSRFELLEHMLVKRAAHAQLHLFTARRNYYTACTLAIVRCDVLAS